MAEEGDKSVGLPLPELEEESTLPAERNMLLGEFSFNDDEFVGNEKDPCPKETRPERRKRCYQHAKAKRACDGGLNLNLGKEASGGRSADSGSEKVDRVDPLLSQILILG